MKMATKTTTVPDEVRAYMSQIGAKRSKAKVQAARENVAKAREARRRDPMDLPCVCTGDASLQTSDHKTTCPRGRLLHQRARIEAAAWFETLKSRGITLSEKEDGFLLMTPSRAIDDEEREKTRRLKPQLLAIVRRAGVSIENEVAA